MRHMPEGAFRLSDMLEKVQIHHSLNRGIGRLDRVIATKKPSTVTQPPISEDRR